MPAGDGHVPGVSKIAVLRANAIGDFIFVLPALHALRAAYPQAEIVLLGQDWHQCFWKDRSGPVDRVTVVPASEGVNDTAGPEDPAALAAFFEEMKRERFDLALQLHGGGRYSNPFTRRLGARVTAGLRAPEAATLERWTPYVYFQPELVRYLEAVALVGAMPVSLEPALETTAADRAECDAVVPADSRPLVLLHPGCGDPRRRWPAEKFGEVGDALAGRGARVVITGTAREQDVCARAIGSMRSTAENCCGRLSLGGLAGLMTRAAVVVSNDSGPLHLATAVGAPSVGIYWCLNIPTAAGLTRHHHRPLPSWTLHCPDCGADCVAGRCDHTSSLVADVAVEEVIAAAVQLLEAERV